jgi:hypothetical protein
MMILWSCLIGLSHCNPYLASLVRVKLRVNWVTEIDHMAHPFIAQWLPQYGHLINHLIVKLYIRWGRLALKQFSREAALCKSIDLGVRCHFNEVVDLSDLNAVAGFLQHFSCEPHGDWAVLTLRGLGTLTSMSQLTSLHLNCEGFVGFGDDEPWELLAQLTSLQELDLKLRAANGGPSTVSALTNLSSLMFNNRGDVRADDLALPKFSSLQPLSTLQQLEVLHLKGHACETTTSLQGLAGLSKLKVLKFDHATELSSLEGISPAVTALSIWHAESLVSLIGIEVCTSLDKLSLCSCCILSSLYPSKGLSRMTELEAHWCAITSLEGLESMSLQSLSLLGILHLSHPLARVVRALLRSDQLTCDQLLCYQLATTVSARGGVEEAEGV